MRISNKAIGIVKICILSGLVIFAYIISWKASLILTIAGVIDSFIGKKFK